MNSKLPLVFGLLVCCVYMDFSHTFPDLMLPGDHVPYFLNNNEDIKTKCEQDASCQYQVSHELL